MESSKPKKFGSYEILDVIADGGMATVYRGVQPSLDRPVAIKVLSRQLSGDEDAQIRFQREARTVAKLSHANVIQIIDYGVSDESCFIVMEYVDGPSLDAVVGKRGIPKIYQAVTIGLQVAIGLEHAHGRGIVHRDIKPANILLDRESGDVKVTDFGIARLTSPDTEDRTLTRANVAMGTLDYMSPEQRRQGGKVDERTDIFAFGVLMYEMVSGHTPVGRFRDLHEVRDDTPPALNDLVQRCLQEDPEDRYASFTEVIAELKKLSEKELAYRETISRLLDMVVKLPRKITGQVEQTARPARRPLLAMGAVAAAVLLLILAVFLGPKLASGPYRDQFSAAEDQLDEDQFDQALDQLRDIRTAAGKTGESGAAAKAQWRIAEIHEEREHLHLAGVAFAYYADTFGAEDTGRLKTALMKASRYKLASGDPVSAVRLLDRLAEESDRVAKSDEYHELRSEALFQSAYYLQEEVRPPRNERQQHWSKVVNQYQVLLSDYPDSGRREEAYWQLADLLADRKEVRDYGQAIERLKEMAAEFPNSGYHPLLAAARIARKKVKDVNLARRLYRQFLDQQPNSPLVSEARKELANL